MKIKYVTYTGVTKKWRNKYHHDKNSWGYKYARECITGYIILKQNNTSRLVDYKKLLRTRAFRVVTL